MQKLKQKVADIIEHAEPNLSLIGLFGTLGYPVYYLIWTYLYPQPYENLGFRIFCACLSMPWLLYRELPKRLKELFPVYFFLSLFIVMPYFFSFMMLKNEWSLVWAMSFMAGTFLLTLIIFDWVIILTMTGAGFMAAFATVFLLDGSVSFAYFVPEYIPIFLFSIAGGIIANHKRQLAHQSRISLMRSLSGSIAHEMRNPLSSITNAISTVQSIIPDKPASSREKEKFDLSYSGLINIHEVIDESLLTIKRGNKIIDSLLATLQDGVMDINNFRKLSAKQIIQTAVATYGYNDINDRTFIVENTDETFDFLGDKDLFIYVLFNLIKNALHYKSRPDFRIEIATKRDSLYNRIRVRDNGPGISPGKREIIFERFYTFGKSGGNGLGLSFCRRVIESFGGSIVCNSEEGHWTEFVISLPAYASKPARDLKKEILKQKKILIVDDQISNRLLLARYASEWDCPSDLAENGAQALEMISKTRYDLILMDFEMPSLDGDHAVARLRAALNIEPSLAPHYMQVPVVGITALPPCDALPRAARCGMNEVISKPVKKRDINRLFEQHFFSETSSATTDRNTILMGSRILLVDDNETSRKFMSMIMQRYGCAIGQAENGKVALDLLEKEDYDLILMDMEMPVMNGVETAMAIRKGDCFRRFGNFRSVPIIALTGNTGKESIEQVKKAGMNQHLGKPVFRDDLVAAATMWIKNTANAEENGHPAHIDAPSLSENFREAVEREKILDHSIISSLKEIGGDELLVSLIGAYRSDSEKIVEELDRALETGDIRQFDQLMHTLKGSSGSIGANRLFVLSRHLNEFSHRGEWPEAADWQSVLKNTFGITIDAMDAMLKTLRR